MDTNDVTTVAFWMLAAFISAAIIVGVCMRLEDGYVRAPARNYCESMGYTRVKP